MELSCKLDGNTNIYKGTLIVSFAKQYELYKRPTVPVKESSIIDLHGLAKVQFRIDTVPLNSHWGDGDDDFLALYAIKLSKSYPDDPTEYSISLTCEQKNVNRLQFYETMPCQFNLFAFTHLLLEDTLPVRKSLDFEIQLNIVSKPSRKFSSLYADNDLLDINLIGVDGDINAHGIVLAAHSSVLKNMITDQRKTANNDSKSNIKTKVKRENLEEKYDTQRNSQDVSQANREIQQGKLFFPETKVGILGCFKTFIYLEELPDNLDLLEQLLVLGCRYEVNSLVQACSSKILLMVTHSQEKCFHFMKLALKHRVKRLFNGTNFLSNSIKFVNFMASIMTGVNTTYDWKF